MEGRLRDIVKKLNPLSERVSCIDQDVEVKYIKDFFQLLWGNKDSLRPWNALSAIKDSRLRPYKEKEFYFTQQGL